MNRSNNKVLKYKSIQNIIFILALFFGIIILSLITDAFIIPRDASYKLYFILFIVFILFITLFVLWKYILNKKLSIRLTVFSLLIAIIPLSISAYISQNIIAESLIKIQKIYLQNISNQVATNIDRFIIENLNKIRTEANFPEFVEYLSSVELQKQVSYKNKITGLLVALKRYDPIFISSYALLDNNGKIIIDTYGNSNDSIKSIYNYYSYPLKTGLPYFSDLSYSKSSKKTSFYFSSPVRNTEGKIIGILRLRYNAIILQSILYRESQKSDYNLRINLIDDNFILLGENEHQQHVFKTIKKITQKEKDSILKKQVYFILQDEKAYADTMFISNLKTNQLFFYGRNHINYQEYLFTQTQLVQKPWKVVVGFSRAFLLDAQAKQLLYYLLLFFGFIVIIVICSLLVIRKLLFQIRILSEFVAEIDLGNKKSQSFSTYNDEITELSQTFIEMADSIVLYENQQKQANARLQLILDTMPDAVFIHKANGDIIDVNKRFAELYGYSSDEAKNLKVADLSADGFTQEMAIQRINQAAMLGEDAFEWMAKRNDSTTFPIFVRLKKMELFSEEYVIAIVTDLSKQKKTEEQLLKSQQRNKALIDANPDLLFVFSKDGYFIDFKYENSDLLILPPLKFINKHIKDVLPEDLALLTMSKINSVLKTGKMETYEYYLNIDGIRYYEARIVLCGNDELLAIVRDITEKKLAEHKLLEINYQLKDKNDEYLALNEEYIRQNEEVSLAKQKAEESDKLKSVFLANMSHEIRTPMNAIMGFAQIIEETDVSKEELTEYSKIIRQRSDDLLNIINDILDISKIEAGQMSLHYSSGNLVPLFDEINQFFKSKKIFEGKRNIELIKNVKISSEESEIITDFTRLKQIFINLLQNAYKFTDKGYIEFGCDLYSSDKILFYVKDSGVGIPKDKVNIIFERFRQVDETISTRKAGGTGLGLSISKGLIELMDGNIWVESTENVGTTFFFTLPYTPVQTTNQKNITFSNIHYNWADKSILIIEDDEFNLKLLNSVLKTTQAKITTLTSGQSLLNRLENLPYDLILMDIRLPEISGLDITQKIKQIHPQIIIIAQTAYAADEDREKCILAGCDDFISKPINNKKLLEMIDKFLKKEKEKIID